MTTASTANLVSQPSHRPLISRESWIWLIALGVCFSGLHWNYLYRMWRIALSDNNWSHAMIVPLISGYYIYQNRHRLAACPHRISGWGLPILFAGLFSYAFWIFPGRNDMFQGYSMIVALFGLVLFVLGTRAMRVLWFPVCYLVFGVKVADRIWSLVAVKLQFIAAEGATLSLKFLTVFIPRFIDVQDHGSTIDLTFRKLVEGVPSVVTESLNVAEACSGLRMLMAFLALGVALAFLVPRPWWQRLVMCSMTVPIALAVNIGRVTTIGVLYLFNKDMAGGDFHIFVGMLMLIPAAGLFLFLGWVMNHLVLPDSQAPPSEASLSPAMDAPTEASLPVGKGVLLGLGGGVIVLLASGAYWQTLLHPIPTIELPGVPTILEVMGTRLSWTLLLPALIGSVLAMLLLRQMVAKSPAGRRVAGAMYLAVGILLASGVVQGAVIAETQTVLHKQAVPIREHLYMLPQQAGAWRLIHQDPPLSKEIEDELGTDEYISWVYEDTRWPKGKPGSLVRLHVAYYTGKADTVPHVPERCFLAGGAQWLGKYTAYLDIDGPDYVHQSESGKVPAIFAASAVGHGESRIPSTTVPATVFSFSTGKTSNAASVLYFFAANGRFFATPDAIRANGFDPKDQYAYYCKIEVQCFGVTDPKVAEERTTSFLSALLPEIMACLPDWVDVSQGRWPLKEGS